MKRNLFFTSMLLICLGCSRTAHLYPTDNSTVKNGIIEAKFSDSGFGSGNGSVKMNASDGEIYTGEYSIVRGGAVGFGSLIGSVYTSQGNSATLTGSSTEYSVEGKSQGVAFALGSSGTRIDCEFVNDNWSGHGFGACKTSKNQLYKLVY